MYQFCFVIMNQNIFITLPSAVYQEHDPLQCVQFSLLIPVVMANAFWNAVDANTLVSLFYSMKFPTYKSYHMISLNLCEVAHLTLRLILIPSPLLLQSQVHM